MKIKLLVSRCGPTVSDNAGDEIDVPDDTAHDMCESVPPQATYVDPKQAREKAVPKTPKPTTAPKPEKTVKPKPEKRAA